MGDPNDVLVTLAPEVVSSLDGTLQVHAIALSDRSPVSESNLSLTIDYKDRNGAAHTIASLTGVTDSKGSFDAVVTGLKWDGTGIVKVQALTGAGGTALAEGQATFAVLDRTPPVVTILPPPSSQVHINNDTIINVHVTDEIGVSQVLFETTSTGNNNNRQRSSVVTSGSTDATVPFTVQVNNNVPIGTIVTVYALAEDLSGNQAPAVPITVTVAP